MAVAASVPAAPEAEIEALAGWAAIAAVGDWAEIVAAEGREIASEIGKSLTAVVREDLERLVVAVGSAAAVRVPAVRAAHRASAAAGEAGVAGAGEGADELGW